MLDQSLLVALTDKRLSLSAKGLYSWIVLETFNLPLLAVGEIANMGTQGGVYAVV